MVELVLTRKAQKFYQQAPPDLAQRLNRCFDQLCQDPYNSTKIKSLKGEFAGCFRYRVGDWRVIYKVDLTSQMEPTNVDQDDEGLIGTKLIVIYFSKLIPSLCGFQARFYAT